MSLDPNITASIIVTGVSLGCFDSRQKRWEVGFIGADRHDMMISIIKKVAGDDITVLPKTPIAHGSEISVRLVGGSASTSPGGGHQGDFKEIVDIDKKVHPTNPPVGFKVPTCPVTELRVSPAAKLYAHTDKVTEYHVKLKKKKDGTELERLEPIPTAAGTDITYREGKVTISITGATTAEYSVPNEPGFRFEVWLDNTCPPVTSPPAADDDRSARAATTEKVLPNSKVGIVENHSDFVLNYKVLNVKEDDQRDLELDIPPGRGEGAICNYSHMSGRDSMFPLPS